MNVHTKFCSSQPDSSRSVGGLLNSFYSPRAGTKKKWEASLSKHKQGHHPKTLICIEMTPFLKTLHLHYGIMVVTFLRKGCRMIDVKTDWKQMLLLNDCYMTVSGQFFALCMLFFHKTEVQTVIFICSTGLNFNWFKS